MQNMFEEQSDEDILVQAKHNLQGDVSMDSESTEVNEFLQQPLKRKSKKK